MRSGHTVQLRKRVGFPLQAKGCGVAVGSYKAGDAFNYREVFTFPGNKHRIAFRQRFTGLRGCKTDHFIFLK
jgi:hypothetical protein